MENRWKNLKEKYTDDRQLRQKIYIGVLLIAVCCLLVGILARYIKQSQTGNSQITSENFYFTTNLLGDTKMVSEDGQTKDQYAFGAKSTEGTWYLYGASEHNVTVNVQNYFDKLRVTPKDIQYTGTISVKNKNGETISASGTFPKLKKGNDAFTSGTLKTGTEGTSDELTLAIPKNSEWDYEDGTVVTLTLKSTSPYKKTLTMKFVLYATDTNLKYRVEDSAGSPYAELIMMTNVDGSSGVQPYLTWDDGLKIDNTNPLTFSYASGTFTQQQGMTDRNMQVSEKLKTGRSESIYFFKKDTSKNYSQSERIVNPVNDTYTITVN